MGNACSSDHSENEDPRIAVTLSREEELAAGASTGEGKGQSSEKHACKIPDSHSVGHRLAGEAWLELAKNQVCNEGCHREADDAHEQMGLAEKEKVT